MSSLVKSKDSQWLQIEVCREFVSNCCQKQDCKFAHPTQNVEILSGKVMACYDSFKGKCNREICKYFHPPSHLMGQLLTKGRSRPPVKTATIQHVPMMGSMGFPTTEIGIKRSAINLTDLSFERFYSPMCKRVALEVPIISPLPYQPVQPIFSFPAPAECESLNPKYYIEVEKNINFIIILLC